MAARINALLNGAPAALDTLDEIAAALGDDENHAATMLARLGGLGGLADMVTNLDTLAKFGLFQFADTATGNPASGQTGSVWHTEASGELAQQIVLSDSGDTYSRRRTDATLTWTAWRRVWDNKHGDGLLDVNGYEVLPSGLILQWGGGVAANNQRVNFPIAFPNTFLHVKYTGVNGNTSAATVHIVGYRNADTTGFNFTGYTHAGATVSGTTGFSYLALGY